MKQRTRRLLATVALAPLMATVLGSGANAGSPPRRVAVEATFHDPGHAGFSNPGLDCAPGREGVCALLVDGVTTWTGDWRGTTTYHATGYQRAPGEPVRWEVWETFTGTVAGCGTGKFDWYGTGTIDFAKPDPSTGTFPMEGTLQIVGPGQGGLVGMTGTAIVKARLSLAPGVFSQNGRVTGELNCR